MEENSKVYRIRTKVGEDSPNVIHVPINQTYDTFEILSLKLNQTDTYKTYESGYGIIVGRVIANGGFGVPNSKVSVFIEVDDNESLKDTLLYNFTSTSDTDNNGVRYNLLPDYVEAECHQDVGTFPNKRLVLDNDDVIEIFDKYWKYTTTTNNSGDYMLFGIPTGSQQLHVDIDLSDCGVLSQRPHNMIGKGYDIGMFESPNKFKSSTNLNSLPQIVTEDRGVYVYPYWGDTSNGDNTFAITRCDINIEYKFEPTAVFMGSIITDKGSNAIGKNCTATINNGKMSELVTGEGTIEMIRKTIDGRVEQFPIMGNRLIDGDGTWVYEIPMNLDYVTTDEFGNFVPTDNPDKGIATRARVRFRVRLDDTQYDNTARKRACYLIPNNPRLEDEGFDKTMEVDYEFGSLTREESYRDLFWNKVYTVKSYIPKIQKGDEQYNRQHTGIKWVNHANQNNPMPYNTLTVKLSFVHRIICILTGLVVQFVAFINQLISTVSFLLAVFIHLPSTLIKGMAEGFGEIWVVGPAIEAVFKGVGNLVSGTEILGSTVVKKLTPKCIVLDRGFCDDNVNKKDYYPGCGWFLFYAFEFSDVAGTISDANVAWRDTKAAHNEQYSNASPDEAREPENDPVILHNCYENALAQENEATSFNFNNDWINGTLYAPLWYRKITPKKRFFFGLFSRKAKDEWCSSKQYFPSLRYIQHCAIERDGSKSITNFDGDTTDLKFVRNSECEDGDCHERHVALPGLGGVIHNKKTMLGQDVYYYKPVEWSANLPSNELYTGKKKGELKLLFATDIVLLGSLDSCDMNGIPQFFKNLESTTYNMPGDILFTDYEFHYVIDPETGEATSNINTLDSTVHSEMAGCDWGNPNEFNKKDGGLFYGIGCTNGDTKLYAKSCVNLSRICEYGVSLDVTKQIPILEKWNEETSESEIEQAEDGEYYKRLITDGFISWDELYNLDERSMFATMNGNHLKTKINTKNGLKEYDFRYLYPENFDGSLAERMKRQTQNYPPEINYKYNYLLEKASRDYYLFRMGNKPYYYDSNNAFPRYENSFYFYFGLNEGKTAIEKFNSKYFAECDNEKGVYNNFNIYKKSSSWCSSLNNTYDGFIALDLEKIATPYDIVITGDNTYTLDDIRDEKIIFYNYKIYSIPEGFEDYSSKKFEEFEDENKNIFIPNGAYYLTITDANEEEYHYELDMSYNFLMYSNNVQSFKKNHEDLLRSLGTNNAIMNDNTKLVYSNPEKIEREIGGVITVYGVHDNDGDIEQYKIEVREKVDFDKTDIQKTIKKEGETWYDKDGVKHTASSKHVGTTVEDYDQMKKELIIPEWYDKNAVKHYLTEKDEEGTQQADFKPLVKELRIVGYTWYDEEDNAYKVTSVADGKIHYTINGEGDYTINGDTWYDAEGYFCEVTKIDTDGTIHYTKNGEGDNTIVGRNTVVDYTDWTLELNLPTYYDKNGKKQYYHYQPNKETSVVDFELTDRLKKLTSFVPQGNEILTVEQWNGLSTEEKSLFDEVYINKQDSSKVIDAEAYNQLPDYNKDCYEEVYVKNDGTEILTKEQWEALAPDVRANYTKMYRNKYAENDIIAPEDWVDLTTEYCKRDYDEAYVNKTNETDVISKEEWKSIEDPVEKDKYAKMYRNKYDIIHYTKNGEGDYRGRATWYDADGNLYKVTSIGDDGSTIHYSINGKGDYTDKKIGDTVVDYTDWVLELTPPTWYDLDGNFCEVTSIVPPGEEVITAEKWSTLTSTEKEWYDEYVNKVTIIHYTKKNVEGDFIIGDRNTVTEVTFNSSLENAPILQKIGTLDKGDIYVEKIPLGVDDVEYGIGYKIIYPYSVTPQQYESVYYRNDYDYYSYVNNYDEKDIINVDTYNELPDYNQNSYEEVYVNRDDETDIRSKEQWEELDPDEQDNYAKKYKNKYDATIITPEDWGDLPTEYCKHDYELYQYVNKTDETDIITVNDYNILVDEELYLKKEVYCLIEDKTQYISKTEYEKNVETQFLYEKRYIQKGLISVKVYDELPNDNQDSYVEVYVKNDETEFLTKEQWEALDPVEKAKYTKMYQYNDSNYNNKVIAKNTYIQEGKPFEEIEEVIINYTRLTKDLKTNQTEINFVTKNTKVGKAVKKESDGWHYDGNNIIKGDYIINYESFLTPLEDGDYYYTYEGIRKPYTVETPNIVENNNELDFTSLVRVLSFETWLDEEGALCDVTSVDTDGTIYYTKNGEGDYTIIGRNTVINYNQPIWTKTTRSDDNYSWVDKNGVTQYAGAEKLVVDYSWLLETTTQEEIVWYDKEGNVYKVTSVVAQHEEILTDEQWSTLTTDGKTLYEEVYVKEDGEETIILSKDEWEILDPDEQTNYDKMYRNKVIIIHYTMNGVKKDEYIKELGDIVVDFNHDKFVFTLDEIGDAWYDEEGNFCEVTSIGDDGSTIHYSINGEGDKTDKKIGDTVVNYYKFMTEPLYLPTWYDEDGNLYKVTSIDVDGTIHYTKNGEEEDEEHNPYIIKDRDTVVDWSEYIGYEGGEITYDNGVITNITNVLWYDSEKQSFAFGVPDENRTYVITVTQICDDNDTNNEIKTNVFVSGVIKYKMFINGIDYEIIKNFDGHTGWNYNGTITKNKLSTNVNDLNENNPWFNVDKIYYHDYFGSNENKTYPQIKLTDIERFGIDKNESEQTYAIYATEIDKEDEEIGKKVNETYHGEDGQNKTVKAEDVIATFVKQRNEDNVTTYKVIDFTVKKLTVVGDTWYDKENNVYNVTSIVPPGEEVITVERWNTLTPTEKEWYEVYEYVNTDASIIISKEEWEGLSEEQRDNYKPHTYINKFNIIHYTKNGESDYIIVGYVWYDEDGNFCEVTSIDTDGTIHYTKNGEGNYAIVGRNTVVDYSDWKITLDIITQDTKNYFKQYKNKYVSTDFISPETYNRLPKYNQKSYYEVYVNKQDSSVILPETYNQLPDYNKDCYEEVYVKNDGTEILTKEQWEALESVEERAKYTKMYRNKYDTTKIITPDQWDDLSSVYCQEDYTKMYRNEHDATIITSEDWGKLPKYCQEDYTEVYLTTWYDKNGTLNYMLPSEEGQKRIDFRPLVKEIEKEGETWYDVNSVKRVAGSDDIGQEVLDYSKENNGLTELKEITFKVDKTWYDKNGIENVADSDKLGLYIDITYMTKGDDTILFNIYNEDYIDKVIADNKLIVDNKVVVDKDAVKYVNKQYSTITITPEIYNQLHGGYSQKSYDEVYVNKTDERDIRSKEDWESIEDPVEKRKYDKMYRNKYDETKFITPDEWAELSTEYCKNDYSFAYKFNRNGLHSVRIYLTLPEQETETPYKELLNNVINFKGCSDLNTIVLPNIGITTIGDSVFNGCKSLTSIDLPDSITAIGANAFKDCEKLSSVYIPYNVTTIGANAFNGCKSLTNIVLPKNIATIGANAFANCEKLQSVRAEMTIVNNNGNVVNNISEAVNIASNAFDNTNIGLVIYVPMDKDGKTYDVSTTSYNKAGWGDDVQDKVVAIELTVFNYNKVNINPSDLLDEFARNIGDNKVYYNFIDSYVAGEYKAFTQVTYFKASDFVSTINNVLSRRREIADRMLKTFYMTEEGVSKNFEITSNTDEMPVQPIIVYHEEEVDDESEYILTNANLTYEQTNMLQNVNIPTITYKSSPFFGDGTSADDIIITKSNNIEKKPSSTGIMNVKQKSIPLDSGNKDFPSISLSSGVKAINPSKTNIADLFEFPVIDKIESSSVSGWTKFSNIPSPNPNNIGMINMDGYVYGRHNNGVVERDGKFETRKLGKYEINLSENLNNNTKPYTYAERRVITGLTNYSIAQWCIVKLRNIAQADDVTEETLKNIWNILFNPTNEENKPTYDKEILLEVIDTMTVVKQMFDEELIIYIQCDETILKDKHQWKIDQGDENCITNSLIQFKNFNVVVSNDNDKKRQYAFTDAKKANLNIGEINENFNFDNELKLSTEIESIDVSGQSLWVSENLTRLSFNQGEKEGGHYQLFALSRYRDAGGPYYSKEDMKQYPLYQAYKASNNGIVYQIGNVKEKTLLSHEGEITEINDKEKKIQGTFDEPYHSPYFYSMYKFKGSNDDERVRRNSESTNGLYKAQRDFNVISETRWVYNWRTGRSESYSRNVPNEYFLNTDLIRHVYCVYVKGNIKMLSPLYEFAPTQLVGTCGNLETYDEGTKSVIGVKVNDYARVYFKNYDYTLGGPFKIKRKYASKLYTHTIPEGTIKYKDEEYYYMIVDKLEDEIYEFEYNMGHDKMHDNFHEDHVIAKDITDLRHLTWTNGNELKRDKFILIKWVVPESDSFRFISEQKNTETEDFVELATVEKVYRKGEILTRLPKNNGQHYDDGWVIHYMDGTDDVVKNTTDDLLNGNIIIDKPCIITKQNKNE